MSQLVAIALEQATVGQLAAAIQSKLHHNEEVKIKRQWIRVQHTAHCDRITSWQNVDAALGCNLLRVA